MEKPILKLKKHFAGARTSNRFEPVKRGPASADSPRYRRGAVCHAATSALPLPAPSSRRPASSIVRVVIRALNSAGTVVLSLINRNTDAWRQRPRAPLTCRFSALPWPPASNPTTRRTTLSACAACDAVSLAPPERRLKWRNDGRAARPRLLHAGRFGGWLFRNLAGSVSLLSGDHFPPQCHAARGSGRAFVLASESPMTAAGRGAADGVRVCKQNREQQRTRNQDTLYTR